MDIDTWSKHRTLAGDVGVGQAVVDTERYLDPAVYKAECDKIFRRTWLLVGRESEVAKPGDYIMREILPLDAEAIVVRGKDGVIRAFFNTCAHRGSALVNQSEGSAAGFVCPYHAWSYGLDGKCRAIPGEEYFPDVDKKTIGLTPIHTDTWNGFVFLNFDEAPRQTLAEYLGEFGERYSDIPFEEFTHGVELTQDIDTNWKCFLDSFFEGYHVPVLHRKSLPMVPTEDNPLNVYYDTHFLPPHSSLIIQSNPHWVPDSEILKFVYSATGSSLLPTQETGETKPETTRLSQCRGVNPIDLPNFGLRVLFAFPFTQILIFDDRYVTHQFWPMGPEKTRFILRFYSRKAPASFLEEFGEGLLVAGTRDVLSEDVAMTRIQQRGMKSGGVKQMYLGENELAIRFTHEAIQNYLKQD